MTFFPSRRVFNGWFLAVAALATAVPLTAQAQSSDGPDKVVKKLSDDVVQTLKANKNGIRNDVRKISAYVDARVIPSVSMDTMVSLVIGQPYNKATPEQKIKLQNSYKNLLIRTYAGALKSFDDHRIDVRMLKNPPDGKQQEIRTRIVGNTGEPVALNYRLEQESDGSWKIYDVAVAGAWMSNTYQNQYGPLARDQGLDAAAAAMDKSVNALDK